MSYTYLIGWKNLNTYYYGVRYAKNSTPEELWQTYFTSSKHVHQFRNEHGDPDIIVIRKTFDCKKRAIDWETKVLRRMNVVNKQNWLNKTDNRAICPESARKANLGKAPWNKGKSIPRSQASIEKQRKTIIGKKRGKYNSNLSDVRLKQLREQMIGNKINAGRKFSEEEKIKRSESGKGIFWSTDGKNEIKSKVCPPEYVRGRVKLQRRTPLQVQEP
jgi:hypothetical protein